MNKKTLLYIVLGILTVAAPFMFPTYQTQLATLWLMPLPKQQQQQQPSPNYRQ